MVAKAAGHTAGCMVMVTSIIDLQEDSSIGDYLIASVGVGGIGVGAAMATLGTAATTLL